MAITFKQTMPINYVYRSLGGTVTLVTSVSDTVAVKNFDIFPDTGVAVNDFVAFGAKTFPTGSSTYTQAYSGRKYHNLTFDGSTHLAATAITGVWEYARFNSLAGEWVALSNVVDGTNAFQQAGTVSWEIPDDWGNRANPGSVLTFYVWYVRFRITALTTLTEGGRQGATDLTGIDHTIKVDANGDTTLDDIYSADKAGTRILHTRTGIAATDGAVQTFTDFLSPADYKLLGGAANDLYITVTNFTGAGNVTVQIAGTDSSDTAQTEDITFSANGTYYATKYFKTLNTSQVTAFAPTSCDYAVIQGQWGVIWKQTNSQFAFNCNLLAKGTATNIITENEQIVFMNAFAWYSYAPAIVTVGTLYAADKVQDGSHFIYEAKSADYSACTPFTADSILYDFSVRHKTIDSGYGNQGHWTIGVGSSGQSVARGALQGMRNTSMVSTNAFVQGLYNAVGHNEGDGCLNVGYVSFGKFPAFRSGAPSTGMWIHRADVANVTSGAMQVYRVQSINGSHMHCVDWNWGDLEDSGTTNAKFVFYTDYPATYQNAVGSEDYSVVIKVVAGKGGNGVSGAYFTIVNSQGVEVLSGMTNEDGYIHDDSGTVTSISATTLTDSTKAWSTITGGEKRYREVFITGGTGAGQRRYILPSGGTATSFETRPGWFITPDTTSRYIIVPYFEAKTFVPVNYNAPAGTRGATMTDNSPFTIKVWKSGFDLYEDPMILNGPVVGGEIALKRSVLDLT